MSDSQTSCLRSPLVPHIYDVYVLLYACMAVCSRKDAADAVAQAACADEEDVYRTASCNTVSTSHNEKRLPCITLVYVPATVLSFRNFCTLLARKDRGALDKLHWVPSVLRQSRAYELDAFCGVSGPVLHEDKSVFKLYVCGRFLSAHEHITRGRHSVIQLLPSRIVDGRCRP